MTTAGSNITKANIVAKMQTLASYNSGIVWGTDNNPFSQSTPVGGDTNGYSETSLANFSDTNVTASTIYDVFRNYAYLLARIRVTRLVKWYQVQGNTRNNATYDNTQVANLNNDYSIDTNAIAATSGPFSGNTISAANLDSFVDALSTGINNNRGSTVTIEEFYCHSNCHGSCHGSI
jgi:hypothetical protein